MGAALLAHRGPNVLRSAAIGDTYMLRLTPVQFQELADEFHEYRVQEANGGHPRAETSEKMVETYLYFLGGGGYLSSVGRPQGLQNLLPISMSELLLNSSLEYLHHVTFGYQYLVNMLTCLWAQLEEGILF